MLKQKFERDKNFLKEYMQFKNLFNMKETRFKTNHCAGAN
jgi:hypothetical protein